MLRRRHGGPSLLSPVRVFRRELIHKKRDSVNGKVSRSVMKWSTLGFGGFNSRDIDSQMMGKPRAIAAIEPIKGDTVFIADSVGRVNG